MSGFWDAMAPFPPAETSQVVPLFILLILGLSLASISTQVRTLLRAMKLRALVRELMKADEGLDCQDDVDELTVRIRKACPPLNVPAHTFRKSTFERNHQVYSSVSARSVFETHLPGGQPGGGLTPTPLLQAIPLLLFGLGLFGGLLGFMEVVSAQSVEDQELGLGALVVQAHSALRAVAWGLFMSSLTFILGRWALRESSVGGSQLVDWIDSNLKQGDDEELASRLFKLQERSEQNLSRSTKALDTLMELQQGTAQHLIDNKTTIDTLGQSIQSSFTDSIQTELGPILQQMNAQAKASTEGSQQFIEHATQQQVAGIDRIIATVMEGIDQAVGANLKAASESMTTVATQQTETLTHWSQSVEKMERLVSELHQISDEMRQGADAISVGIQPIGNAASQFLSAASKLHEVLPSIQGASTGYVQAQEGLQNTAQVLQDGTQALEQMAAAQKGELALWKERSEAMTVVLSRVETSMNQMEDFSRRFAEASGPTREAAEAFSQVSESIKVAIPGLVSAVKAQTGAGEAIEGAANRIQEGTQGYLEAARLISDLVKALEKAHHQSTAQQSSSVESQERQLEAWNQTIASLSPMLEQTRKLVGQVHTTTGELSGFTTELRDAAAPTKEAAQAFESVTQVIQAAIPTIESSVSSHGKVGDAIDQAAKHLESSTGGYLDAAELVRKLIADLDASHRKLSTHRKASDDAQSAHLDSWNQALDHLAPTVTQLESVVQGLHGGIADIGQFTERLAEAATPTAQAADSFRKISEVIEGSIPAFHSNLQSQEAMRKAIDEASRRIQHGTTGYLQAAELVKQVLGQVDQNQEDMAKARNLERNAQREQLAAWGKALDRLLPALDMLQRTTVDLDGLSSNFANAAHPAIEAGAAFHNAALEVGRILPQLETAREGYEAINTSLSSTAQELARSSQSYTTAGTKVGQLLGQMETSMSLQQAGNEELVKTLDRASRFTEKLPEASKLVEDAAQGLQGASLRTAEVVQSITDAVQVQDDTVGHMKETAKVLVSVLQRQSGQWEQFHGEMDRLQQVLDTSVDTFTQQMPEAIDHTLVHFDAALGEGVERLGSAVERLREAMDDLQERLEQVLDKG